MDRPAHPLRGRGTAANPRNRFVRLEVVADPDAPLEEEAPAPRTEFFRDASRSVIASNDSPDIGFEVSLNPYRGCEHGCIYCYARPMHEYLGFSAGLDFETKILVKADAPRLLRRELSARSWVPKPVAIGTATDPYQPVERRLKLTRQCLQVFAEFRNPATLVTKNHMVTRDIDILAAMAQNHLVVVSISITTLDNELARVMEPRTAAPARRLDAIRQLAAAGIPVQVLVAPIIPGLTDHEAPAILHAAAQTGARSAGYELLRLPHGVADLFQRWLSEHRPDRTARVLNRIRDTRGGRLNDPNFGSRMCGSGLLAEQIRDMFRLARRRAGLDAPMPALRTDLFRRPQADAQGLLF